MKAKSKAVLMAILFSMGITACSGKEGGTGMETNHVNTEDVQDFTLDTKVQDVMNDSAFEGYGRLIFPANMKIDASLTLEDVEEILPWYSEINPDRTVSIVNEMKSRVQNGEQIFYDIYTEEEKAADPDKEDTGLSEVTGTEPPTYACVGTSDGIASYRTMQSRKMPLFLTDRGTAAFFSQYSFLAYTPTGTIRSK